MTPKAILHGASEKAPFDGLRVVSRVEPQRTPSSEKIGSQKS